MRTIAIVNQKGGCGKTTTAINLAGVLARFGERTLLVDLDPQAHCAAGLAIPEDRIDLHIGDAMLAPQTHRIDETRLLWRIRKNLDLAPSSVRLAGLEASRGGVADADDRDERLRIALDQWSDRYDICLIDCPPSIGLLTFNALRAADEVLIPVETGFFSLQGAGRQVSTIRALAKRLGGETPFRLLVTMHDENSSLGNELLAELRRRFGDRVIPTTIRLDAKLKDAVSMGQPIIEYAPNSVGAQDYSDLASWLLGRAAPVLDEQHDAAAQGLYRPRTSGSPTIEPKPLSELNRDDDGIRTSPAPRRDEEPKTALDPIVSRAAELAQRARQLLQRGAELQSRLSADPEVARKMESASQNESTTAPAVETAHPKPAATGADSGPVETDRGVQFRHRAGPTSSVAVAGEFNRWSPSATPLRYNPESGLHEGVVELPPGRCEYRIVLDGVWIADPANPSVSVNPFGETNSVFVVTRAEFAEMATEGAD